MLDRDSSLYFLRRDRHVYVLTGLKVDCYYFYKIVQCALWHAPVCPMLGLSRFVAHIVQSVFAYVSVFAELLSVQNHKLPAQHLHRLLPMGNV